jgi:hypothetical protein
MVIGTPMQNKCSFCLSYHITHCESLHQVQIIENVFTAPLFKYATGTAGTGARAT